MLVNWYEWTIKYYIGHEVAFKKVECNYVKNEFIFHLKGDIPFIDFSKGDGVIVYVPLKYVDRIVIIRGEKTREFDPSTSDSWNINGYVYLQEWGYMRLDEEDENSV